MGAVLEAWAGRAPVVAVTADDQERLLRYRAAREREDGAMFRVQREKIATALTIASIARRDRELHKVAGAIRGYVWCLALSDAAIALARLVETFLRYGGKDAKADLIAAVRS